MPLLVAQTAMLSWVLAGLAVTTLATAAGWRRLLEGLRHELAAAFGVAWLLVAVHAVAVVTDPLARLSIALLAAGIGVASLTAAVTGRPVRHRLDSEERPTGCDGRRQLQRR